MSKTSACLRTGHCTFPDLLFQLSPDLLTDSIKGVPCFVASLLPASTSSREDVGVPLPPLVCTDCADFCQVATYGKRHIMIRKSRASGMAVGHDGILEEAELILRERHTRGITLFAQDFVSIAIEDHCHLMG